MPPKKAPAKGTKTVAKTKGPVKAKTPAKAGDKTASSDGAPKGAEAAALPPEISKTIGLKLMAPFVFNDDGGEVKESGRWAMVIDMGGRAPTFARYQNCNYLNATNPVDMLPEHIRMAVLGGIRYGKPFVFDLGDGSKAWDDCVARFSEVQPGLMQNIMNKSILQDEKYLTLVKDGDGDEYSPNHFAFDADHFKFIILTETEDHPKELLRSMYVVHIE